MINRPALASLVRIKGRSLLDEDFLFVTIAACRLLALFGLRLGPQASLGGPGRFRG